MKALIIVGEDRKVKMLRKQIELQLKRNMKFYEEREITDEEYNGIKADLQRDKDEKANANKENDAESYFEDETNSENTDEDLNTSDLPEDNPESDETLTRQEKTYQERLKAFKGFPEWEAKLTIEMKSRHFQKLKKDFLKETK